MAFPRSAVARNTNHMARDCNSKLGADCFNVFQTIIASHADTTRAAASFGATVTPGNNTYGSYVEVLPGSSLTKDCYEILINFNSSNTTATARDILATIGIDTAGGSSYVDFISHLLCSGAASYAGSTSGGHWYRFKVRIPAGTSIGCKASVNNATVSTLRCHVILMCEPTRPDRLRVGSFVRTFGATPASSSGTAITPGTASEGSWTLIGTAADRLFQFEYGVGINDADTATNVLHTDLAIGSSQQIVLTGGFSVLSSAETVGRLLTHDTFGDCQIGDPIYARMQIGPNAAETNHSIIVYGVG